MSRRKDKRKIQELQTQQVTFNKDLTTLISTLFDQGKLKELDKDNNGLQESELSDPLKTALSNINGKIGNILTPDKVIKLANSTLGVTPSVAATPAAPGTPATTTSAATLSTFTIDKNGKKTTVVNGQSFDVGPNNELTAFINGQSYKGELTPDGSVKLTLQPPPPAPATPATPVAATPVTPTPGAPAVPGTPPVVATNPTTPPAQNSLTPPPTTGTDMGQMMNNFNLGLTNLNQNTQAAFNAIPGMLDTRFNQFAQGFQTQIGQKFEQFGQKIAELSTKLESLFNRLNTMASAASTSSMASVGSGAPSNQVAMTPFNNAMPTAFSFNFGMPASNFQPTTSGMSNPWSMPVNNPVSTMAPQPQLASNIGGGAWPMRTWS